MAQALQKSLRIPRPLLQEIAQIERLERKDFSTTANELLEEAVKMRRCPGIIFSEGTQGRRARIAGTGLEVWEVVSTYLQLGRNMQKLKRAYHWLSDLQLQAALGYGDLYREEIEELKKQNEAWTPGKLQKMYPAFTRHSP